MCDLSNGQSCDWSNGQQSCVTGVIDSYVQVV